MVRRLYVRLLALVALGLVGSPPCLAQELTPRAYWPAPKASKLLILGYSHQSGDVVTDPSPPLSGADSGIVGRRLPDNFSQLHLRHQVIL